eukprot:COSAG01_NODE_58860_length_303_cov_1.225490_1_plen_69_part_01
MCTAQGLFTVWGEVGSVGTPLYPITLPTFAGGHIDNNLGRNQQFEANHICSIKALTRLRTIDLDDDRAC